MKKFGYILAAGLTIGAMSVNGLSASAKTKASDAIAVRKSQMDAIEEVAKDLIDGVQRNVSGPEELFKLINGEFQTTAKETPILAALNSARAKGFRIVCYVEGSEKIVATTDSAVIDKDIGEFKTGDGIPVRDKAIAELKKSKSGRAAFTYSLERMVDGVKVREDRVVIALGREAFPNLRNSKKKFLVTIGGEIDR